MAEKTKEELSEEIKLLQKRITELEKLYTETWQQHQFTRRYETVVRDSNDSIIIHDLEGRITAWNRGAEKMYGYKEKEALGMNIERLTPPEMPRAGSWIPRTCRKNCPKKRKKNSRPKANKCSRRMMRRILSAERSLSNPTKTGMLPKGSITKNRMEMQDSRPMFSLI